MSSLLPLPPNPSLVAILLVINTKDGPRFVFHYPPNPRDDLPPTYSIWKGYGDDAAESDGSSDTGYWSSDDEGDKAPRNGKSRFKHPRGPEDEEDSADESKPSEPRGAAWETVLGFPTDALENLLSPGRSYHKKRFELGLEPLTYLGYPVYIREDGYWRKRREKNKRKVNETGDEEWGIGDEIDLAWAKQGPASHENTKSADIEAEAESDASAKGKSEPPKDDQTNGKSDEEERKAMSMFNVVFVMNPPVLEHNLRVKEMFECVVKKFAKVLKYEQARSNWVWKQSEMILNMKEKAKEDGLSMATLWHQILSKSTLAKALSEVFLSISASKIAHVFISDALDCSLQIPQVSSISELPTVIEPQMPGLWLTTANSFDQDDESINSNIVLAKHFALLLLDDVENILKDIDHEHGPREVSHPLADFVQIVRPTMSFLQISQTHSIPLRRIQVLSRHLIYWRRARAIPPLHQRDTYIVSPNADMRSLPSATLAYAARFPTLQSLPKMLSMLSGHPRAYSTLIPSKDHREAYLEILAWLMKGGWVTQLRTFAWVRVEQWVKDAVRLREEESEATESRDGSGHEAKTRSSDVIASSKDPSLPFSIPSQTRINGNHHDEDGDTTTILLEPHKANNLESRWLDAIGASFTSPPPSPSKPLAQENGHKDVQPDNERELAEVRAHWPRFVKYFNGKHPLEKIPVREGIKKKAVWRWLQVMERKGVLVVVRHW